MKRIIKQQCKEYFVFGENSRYYPNATKLSDIEIVSLAITAEALQIDSENLLWSKLKTDYSNLFQELPHRNRFNALRKSLRNFIININSDISDFLTQDSEYLIIDSMPVPICKLARERSSNNLMQQYHKRINHWYHSWVNERAEIQSSEILTSSNAIKVGSSGQNAQIFFTGNIGQVATYYTSSSQGEMVDMDCGYNVTQTTLRNVDSSQSYKEENISFVLYPNPVTDGLLVIKGNSTKNLDIKVFNKIGRLIWQMGCNDCNEIDLYSSHLETGLNLNKIETQNQTIHKRVIKL